MIININDIKKGNNEFSFKYHFDEDFKSLNHIQSNELNVTIIVSKLGDFTFDYKIDGKLEYKYNLVDVKTIDIEISETEETSVIELNEDMVLIDEELNLNALVEPVITNYVPNFLEYELADVAGKNWKVVDLEGYEEELQSVKQASNPFNVLKQED